MSESTISRYFVKYPVQNSSCLFHVLYQSHSTFPLFSHLHTGPHHKACCLQTWWVWWNLNFECSLQLPWNIVIEVIIPRYKHRAPYTSLLEVWHSNFIRAVRLVSQRPHDRWWPILVSLDQLMHHLKVVNQCLVGKVNLTEGTKSMHVHVRLYSRWIKGAY